MRFHDIITLVESIKIPYAYDHFSEGESPSPPFLCFLITQDQNFAADGRAYQKIDVLNIEIYTDKKSPDLESRVEKILDDQRIPYAKSEVWIEAESLYEVLYQTQILKED